MIDLEAEARRRNTLLRKRLDHLVPTLLAETGIDCWIVMGREYAEDQVLLSMLPAEWLSARRRTILVLTPDRRMAITRYPVGDVFASAWDPTEQPDQWVRLADVLLDLDPVNIGIGMSRGQAHADGVSATEYQAFMSALPDTLSRRVVPADILGIRWLETRLPEERGDLEEAATIAHRILRRGLSREAIVPGETTTLDLVWWYRNEVHRLGLESWFQPSVTVQRSVGPEEVPEAPTIQGGDLVHVDFGIRYRDLCTDQQEHAYVLDAGESRPPDGLIEGLRIANMAQDILTSSLVLGSTGNEILAGATRACADSGISATIYSHAIGHNGHGAGITIGLWDAQDGVPGAGDHRLYPETAISIELMVEHHVPAWDRTVRFMVEQDVWLDESGCSYLDGRQQELWLI